MNTVDSCDASKSGVRLWPLLCYRTVWTEMNTRYFAACLGIAVTLSSAVVLLHAQGGRLPTLRQQEASPAPPARPSRPGEADLPFGIGEQIGRQSLGTIEVDLYSVVGVPLASIVCAALG